MDSIVVIKKVAEQLVHDISKGVGIDRLLNPIIRTLSTTCLPFSKQLEHPSCICTSLITRPIFKIFFYKDRGSIVKSLWFKSRKVDRIFAYLLFRQIGCRQWIGCIEIVGYVMLGFKNLNQGVVEFFVLILRGYMVWLLIRFKNLNRHGSKFLPLN